MGCDIHWTIEVKHDGKWVGVLNDCGLPCKAGDRWYAFFGELAGVRRESDTAYPPKGLPDDVSDLTKYNAQSSAWDHTESWLTIDEFVDAYNRAVVKLQTQNPDAKPVTKNELFGFSYWPIDAGDETRIVFAFDN